MEQKDATEFVKKIPWWIKAFVAWHVYAMTAWSLPNPPPAITNGQIPPTFANVIKQPVPFFLALNLSLKNWRVFPLRWYMSSTGLWQYWDMFAPNPSNLDIWLDAEITLTDGSQIIQPYPRMASLSIPEKFVKERFRKYVERVNEPKDDWKKPALAQWLAYQAATNPNNLPDTIVVRRHFRRIQPFGIPTPTEDTTENMWVMTVDKDKLKKDKGW